MFEKDAEERYKQHLADPNYYENSKEESYLRGFGEGAEFGYNKAKEWHDINNTEPSKEQLGKQLLIRMESVIGDTDYDYLVYKYSGESITDVPGVISWKEIE